MSADSVHLSSATQVSAHRSSAFGRGARMYSVRLHRPMMGHSRNAMHHAAVQVYGGNV
jgi:hypothetical protein